MRYMLVLTYDEAATANRTPDPAVFEEMGRFNQAMVDAGVLLAGEGLARGGYYFTRDGGTCWGLGEKSRVMQAGTQAKKKQQEAKNWVDVFHYD